MKPYNVILLALHSDIYGPCSAYGNFQSVGRALTQVHFDINRCCMYW